MLRQRIILIAAVGTALCLLAGNASGKPIVVHKNPSRGYVITQPHRPNAGRQGVATRLPGKVVTRRSLFHRIEPKYPHHKIIVVRTPYGRRIKAFPSPRPQITPRSGIIPRSIVVVWITNSDGSRTAVELLRRGRGFVGPRGEWYPEIPTKRQIWLAYGF